MCYSLTALLTAVHSSIICIIVNTPTINKCRVRTLVYSEITTTRTIKITNFNRCIITTITRIVKESKNDI